MRAKKLTGLLCSVLLACTMTGCGVGDIDSMMQNMSNAEKPTPHEHTWTTAQEYVIVKDPWTEIITHPAGTYFTPSVEKEITHEAVYDTVTAPVLKTESVAKQNYEYTTVYKESVWHNAKTVEIQHKAGTVDKVQVYVSPTFSEKTYPEIKETITYPEMYTYGLVKNTAQSTPQVTEEWCKDIGCKKYFKVAADYTTHNKSQNFNFLLNGVPMTCSNTTTMSTMVMQGAKEYYDLEKIAIRNAYTEDVTTQTEYTAYTLTGKGLTQVNSDDLTTDLEKLIDEGNKISNWSSDRKAFIQKCLNYASDDTTLTASINANTNPNNANEKTNILNVLKNKHGYTNTNINRSKYKTTTLVKQYNGYDWTETRIVKDGYYTIDETSINTSVNTIMPYTHDVPVYENNAVKYETTSRLAEDPWIEVQIVEKYKNEYHSTAWNEEIEHEAEWGYRDYTVCSECGARQ